MIMRLWRINSGIKTKRSGLEVNYIVGLKLGLGKEVDLVEERKREESISFVSLKVHSYSPVHVFSSRWSSECWSQSRHFGPTRAKNFPMMITQSLLASRSVCVCVSCPHVWTGPSTPGWRTAITRGSRQVRPQSRISGLDPRSRSAWRRW